MHERSKPKADVPPQVEVNASPNSTVTTDTDNPAAIAAAEKADETAVPANLALRKQIEALHHAEQTQRQWAQQRELERQQREMQIMSMKPPSVEERMEWLRQSGVSIGDRKMVLETPGMLDHLEVADFAANQALQAGHQRDTDSYRIAVRQNFQAAMKHLQQQAAHDAPEPFRPPPPPPPQPVASARAALTSAPVSRDVPRGGDYVPSVTSRITLTPDELSIAKSLGLEAKEYAEQKRRMLQAKARGELQQ
jgi:hypothetical protein